MTDIKHPKYYTSGSIETWDFIKDKNLNFDRGNAIKYIVRAGEKDKSKEIEDLKKAIQYINHEIEYLENKENKSLYIREVVNRLCFREDDLEEILFKDDNILY